MKNKEVWNTGKPPEALTEEYLNTLKQTKDQQLDKRAGVKEQIVWTSEECVKHFLESLTNLRKRREESGESLSFDKDDEDALNLVTSASNLRAYNFHIPTSSKFDIKSMAGNIVPAIATTNAIIAGFLVCEALKVMRRIHKYKGEPANYVTECLKTDCLSRPIRKNRKDALILPVRMEEPNKKCFVCSSNSVTIVVNCDKTTLEYFVEEALKNKLALKEPSVLAEDDLIYECGADLDEEEIEVISKRQKKLLKDTRIKNETELIVEDFSQDISWKVLIKHDASIEVEEFYIEGDEKPKEATEAPNGDVNKSVDEPSVAPSASTEMIVDDDTDVVLCVTDESRKEEERNALKRKREEAKLSKDTNPQKTVKMTEEIVIDDE